MSTLVCPNCGAELDESVQFCPHCGLRRGVPRQAASAKSSVGKTVWQVISLLLFLLLGIPAALFGGCMLILASGGSTKWTFDTYAIVYGPIALAVILFVLFLGSFVKRGR